MTDWERRRKVDAKLAYEALMRVYPFTLDNLDGEQWAWIPDYEGRYQESTFGRTKSFKNGKVTIRKPYVDKRGYLRVELYKDGNRKHFGVHQLVALTFIPNFENKPEINHEDGHPMNNCVSNLSWVTNSENIQHAIKTGLTPLGEDCSWAKLTKEQVELIRSNPQNLTCKQLGKIFGVDRRTVGDVQRGVYYKNANGLVRESKVKRTPKEICKKIKSEYRRGVVGFGRKQLAKKYGISPATVFRILNND